MDAVQKELDRLISRAPGNSLSGASRKQTKKKGGAPSSSELSVDGYIDSVIASLERCQAGLDALPAMTEEAERAVVTDLCISQLPELRSCVDAGRRGVEERNKEFYNALAKFGKALDKKFSQSLSTMANPTLFTSEVAERALNRVITDHLVRSGDFEIARMFARESGTPLSEQSVANFEQMFAILTSMRSGDLGPLLSWSAAHREYLRSRSSPLEFYAHRSQFLRILLAGSPFATAVFASDPSSSADPSFAASADSPSLRALTYAREHFGRFLEQHMAEIQRLLASILYLAPNATMPSPFVGSFKSKSPLTSALLSTLYQPGAPPSPYAALLSPELHLPTLEPLFVSDFCARVGASQEPPLKVGVEIGAGGALAKIAKVKDVMRRGGNEWSQVDELPVEIPLPTHLRFHSIFVCPVSKEQTTEENPPMMLPCGHVIASESLIRLSKGGRVKCPYCPLESSLSQATRVLF